MLSIYVCEDDRFQLEQLTKYIQNCILINEYDITIAACHTNPFLCLTEIEHDHPIHGIYFLDIDLKSDINGIELATQIRKIDARAFIIFITTHEEMLNLTFKYKVEALDFIVKDDDISLYSRISDCLSNILTKQASLSPSETDKILFNYHGRDYYIRKQDIYYINASNDHKLTIHHSKGLLEIRGNLSEMIKNLDSDFFHCHRSCIVNLNHISEINMNTGELILDNSTSCLCARRNISAIKKLLVSSTNEGSSDK